MALTERLQIIIDSTTGGAVRGLTATGAAAETTGKKMTLVERAMQSFGLQSVKTGTLLQTGIISGAVLGGVALAKFAASGVTAFVDLADKVRTFQRASGASAEDASALVAVMDDLEINAETGAKAIFRLGRDVGDGTTALSEFGVEVARNRDGTADLTATLLNVADAYASSTDPAERARIAFLAFGRQGAELIPLLEQGREGLKRFFESAEEGHQILSQDDVNKAREYELAVDNLSDAWGGLQREAGGAVVPLLTDMTNLLADATSAADQATGPFGGLGNTAAALFANLIPGVSTLPKLAAGFDSSASAGERFKSIVGGLLPPLGLVFDLFGKGSHDANQLAQAEEKVVQAQTRVADLAAQGKQGTQEFADAQRVARDAAGEYAAKQESVSNALRDTALNASLSNEELQSLINLTLGSAGAQLNYEQAIRNLSRAQLEAAFAGGLDADANARLKDAELQAAQATFALDAAIQSEIEAMGGNAAAIDQAIGRLQFMQQTYPEAAAAIQPLIDRLRFQKAATEAIPTHHHTDVTADTSQAFSQVNAFIEWIRSNRQAVLQVQLAALGGGTLGLNLQHGGEVPGPEGMPVPLTAHGGEYVLSADVVNRIKQGAPSRGAHVESGRGSAADLSRLEYLTEQLLATLGDQNRLLRWQRHNAAFLSGRSA